MIMPSKFQKQIMYIKTNSLESRGRRTFDMHKLKAALNQHKLISRDLLWYLFTWISSVKNGKIYTYTLIQGEFDTDQNRSYNVNPRSPYILLTYLPGTCTPTTLCTSCSSIEFTSYPYLWQNFSKYPPLSDPLRKYHPYSLHSLTSLK